MKHPGPDAPVVLVKWYDYAKWLLERVENFPKSQRPRPQRVRPDGRRLVEKPWRRIASAKPGVSRMACHLQTPL